MAGEIPIFSLETPILGGYCPFFADFLDSSEKKRVVKTEILTLASP